MRLARTAALAGAGALAAACATMPEAPPTADPALLDAQLETMRQVVCPAPDASPAGGGDAPATLAPAQVFDNLYFIGTPSSTAYALTTSEGIILLDALWEADLEDTLLAGFEELGLDPEDIRYVVVTHAHGDHFGGAAHLQERYGAQVVMSPADWYYLVTWPQRGEPAPLPERDVTVLDGDELTLGDTSITIVVTPGHTPGTISPLLTVRDGDDEHRAIYWSGASMGFLSPEELEVYVRSIERYRTLAADADVVLSNHVFADAASARIDQLSSRAPGEPHPFVVGQDGVQAWLDALEGCAETHIAQKRAEQAQSNE